MPGAGNTLTLEKCGPILRQPSAGGIVPAGIFALLPPKSNETQRPKRR